MAKMKKVPSAHAEVSLLNNELVKFSGDPAKKEPRRFEMLLYTGGRVSLGWWGDVVIDLSGVTTRNQMPIFRNHDPNQIAGYSDKVTKDEAGLKVAGTLSGVTEDGRQVADLADEGFPWQASMGLRIKSVEEVQQGAFAEVNGRAEQGPVSIFRKSKLTEGSFVPLGADDKTNAQVFAGTVAGEVDIEEVCSSPRKENEKMDEPKKEQVIPAPAPAALTVDVLKRDHAELANTLIAEGQAAERVRIGKIRKAALAGQDELVGKLIDEGSTYEQALERILAEGKTRMSANLAALKDGAAPLVGKIDPAPSKPAAPADAKLDAALQEWNASAELRSSYGVEPGMDADKVEVLKGFYFATKGIKPVQ